MKYQTYMEYFLDLKNTFVSSYEGVDQEKDIDKDFEKVFLANLLDKVKKAWQDHEYSERDTYLLFEDELEQIWNSSKEEMVGDMLAKLSDLGYIKTAVNADGDIVYSVSEDALEYLHGIKK